MMELWVGGKKLSKYNNVEVTLRYDSIADTFAFKAFFNPNSKDDREIFRPLGYKACEVRYKGKLLMTGTTLINTFREKGSLRDLTTISGYSKSGILGDCTIHPDTQTPQITQRPTLQQIVEAYIKPFGIKVTVDSSVEKECTTAFSSDFSPTGNMLYRPVGDILAYLCSQQHVILSHDIYGNLLLTKPKADKIVTTKTTDARQVNPIPVSSDLQGAPQDNIYENKTVSFNRKPIYRFDASNKKTIWTEMLHSVNGQQLHYKVVVDTERDDTSTNANNAPVTNDMVAKAQNRVRRVEQRDGNSNTTPLTARAVLGFELQGVALTIDIVGWELNGRLVTPNNMIMVKNPNVYLYEYTRFFIQQVEFKGDTEKKTATLTCVLPECFNDETIKDIFG